MGNTKSSMEGANDIFFLDSSSCSSRPTNTRESKNHISRNKEISKGESECIESMDVTTESEPLHDHDRCDKDVVRQHPHTANIPLKPHNNKQNASVNSLTIIKTPISSDSVNIRRHPIFGFHKFDNIPKKARTENAEKGSVTAIVVDPKDEENDGRTISNCQQLIESNRDERCNDRNNISNKVNRISESRKEKTEFHSIHVNKATTLTANQDDLNKSMISTLRIVNSPSTTTTTTTTTLSTNTESSCIKQTSTPEPSFTPIITNNSTTTTDVVIIDRHESSTPIADNTSPKKWTKLPPFSSLSSSCLTSSTALLTDNHDDPTVRRSTNSNSSLQFERINETMNTILSTSNDTTTTRAITNDDAKYNDSLSSSYSMMLLRSKSNRELRRTLSSSPHSYKLYQKEVIEASMQQRLIDLKETCLVSPSHLTSATDQSVKLTNQARNRRRAEHNQAIISDLCEIVADLLLAEKRLFLSGNTGSEEESQSSVMENNSSIEKRARLVENVKLFLNRLPMRYALSVETPSEVLVHMRLLDAARSDDCRAAVHSVNLQGAGFNYDSSYYNKNLKLVTISCSDRLGLLEYITKLLASCGSRVLDADVMTTTDNIALDRFVVEMNGRLRLDKLQQYIETYLQQTSQQYFNHDPKKIPTRTPPVAPLLAPHSQLYFQPKKRLPYEESIHDQVQTAVPLSDLVAFSTTGTATNPAIVDHTISLTSDHNLKPLVRASSLNSKYYVQQSSMSPSAPHTLTSSKFKPLVRTNSEPLRPKVRTQSSGDCVAEKPSSVLKSTMIGGHSFDNDVQNKRYCLSGDREAMDLSLSSAGGDVLLSHNQQQQLKNDSSNNSQSVVERRNSPGLLDALLQDTAVAQFHLPTIPFDELKVLDTISTGRVSTIYRAIWERCHQGDDDNGVNELRQVALKMAVASDDEHACYLEELRQEAYIACSLKHKNICELLGVAEDTDCYCLTYEFCEGGSLLSLLNDTSRCYEYLPIALDIANGMAYLHSCNVIHRDLKPSNILLTKNNRAKVADFGMSVANTGQELTAETGTYRYMAPEVIRHESYSSNADVYSFGVVLWQLITREIPFATLTPIQTAYAVAEGRRPEIPSDVPDRLRKIIEACLDEDSQRRPSFTYIAMALADYAKMAFHPSNVGAKTVEIANDLLANVSGNCTINIDYTAHSEYTGTRQRTYSSMSSLIASDAVAATTTGHRHNTSFSGSYSNITGSVGLEI